MQRFPDQRIHDVSSDVSVWSPYHPDRLFSNAKVRGIQWTGVWYGHIPSGRFGKAENFSPCLYSNPVFVSPAASNLVSIPLELTRITLLDALLLRGVVVIISFMQGIYTYIPETNYGRTTYQPDLTTFLQPRHIPTQGYNITQ